MQAFIYLAVILAAYVLWCQPLPLDAIDIEHAKESKCFEIKETAPYDIVWASSQKSYYYTLMSRYDLFNSGLELSGKQPEDLHEDELYYDSCVTYAVVPGGILGTGFGGNKRLWTVAPIKGLEVFDFYSEDDKGFGSGRCYNTLSDNNTYLVNACCSSTNDQMTWAAFSTVKRLPKETEELIYDHVESLGFKREYFTGTRFDSCDLDKKTDEKNEL